MVNNFNKALAIRYYEIHILHFNHHHQTNHPKTSTIDHLQRLQLHFSWHL